MDDKWIPVYTAVTGGLVGFLGAVFIQWRIKKKELAASERKRQYERAVIGSQILVMLADFNYNITRYLQNFDDPYFHPPEAPNFDAVKGDWTALEGKLLLRIIRIPLIFRQFSSDGADVYLHQGEEAKRQFCRVGYSRIGEECSCLITALMKHCNLPSPSEISAPGAMEQR